MHSRYLTKSKFQLSLQCKTKLFYADKPQYANKSMDDPFLQSLADGGFQVGALAKCYIPGGHDIEVKDQAQALLLTEELMKLRDAVIYEGAFCAENLFVRTDILVKSGNHLELIEVKAKSYDAGQDSFLKKNGTVASAWRNYLDDIAFQKHVLSLVYPQYEISASLMLVNKTARCPVAGLNQKFRVSKDKNNRRIVKTPQDLPPDYLEPPMLIKVNADACCELIYREAFDFCGEPVNFAAYIARIADYYVQDKKILSSPCAICKNCEFQAIKEELKIGMKSGLRECWKESLGWEDKDFEEETVLDLWNFRKKNVLIGEGVIKLRDVSKEEINPSDDGHPGLSTTARQWLQIEKCWKGDSSPWLDRQSLFQEMQSWVYPLHFIDFETSMAAIPFNKGRHPYEGIAFQFSHHIVNRDGSVRHKGQFLNAEPGVFPNYEFIQALKHELEQDEGTIFRYAAHENTYLNIIRTQLLEETQEPENRKELCTFIESITSSAGNSDKTWQCKRNMVDMLELVKRFYFHPATKGSNSIKYVLPAIIGSSSYLQQKYSEPIYGAEDGIPSLNFKDWIWVKFDQDKSVIDPYKLLPKMFLDLTDKENDLLSEDDDIRNGGAALTAYARMQFEDMSDYERSETKAALLKYCELDTLAMVMIYEGWREEVKNGKA